ncbi:MAG: glycoside hydrolase family 16 protein [Actinomycetes bacterium]
MATPQANAAIAGAVADSAVAARAAVTTKVVKGVVGTGKVHLSDRLLSVKPSKASSKSLSVAAGSVNVATTFSNRCGPVTLTLSQAGQQVAKATGRSGFKASAPVASGALKMTVGSAACRTSYKLRVVNTPAPTMTPTTPAIVTSTPTSTAMPVGDLPGWKSVFAQDFNTPAALGSFLTTYKDFGAYPYGYTDTSRNLRSNPGYYHPEKTLSASNGAMDAWLHYDATLGKYLVAAPKPLLPTMTYGRFAMRLRADSIPGYKIAPLLWPDSGSWPSGGEIDFPEGDLDGTSLAGYAHWANPNGGQDYFNTRVDPTTWHVYEVIWTPGKVQFLVDGKSLGVSTTNVPSNPMHWVLQMETEISSTAPSTNAQGHVQIDWVKAYSMA